MMDFMKMMKQAKELQARMGELQAELEALEVEGTAGGGLVTVTLSAKGGMRGLKVDPSLIKPEEAEILEDLIIAAHADARRKAEAAMAEKMQDVTGGLQLPPGMNLPGM
ncbi:YbaB/EbfC family nucleoid-associated protein [Microbaculum marinisediminis]|uniref:Nucleoid-associated protein MUB46_03200 n=1 Tax=Microbaculum marinisediminis TaxID=2931392 RepID=A0AAW5QWT7_9HYPH|nr:YbaB/EbfC family nucleoid-associated protein [Microbaculum sp. A6E488]MCT8970858.1 YbaB/EbfC family nucleoid-associated protein [Microbaculum sp. A6E488]